MHPVLSRNQFLVKEQVGIFKASNNFDVLDPENGTEIMHCREDSLGFFTKMFRFSKRYKRNTPFDVEIRTPDGQPIIRITRGVSFFLSKVDVYNDKQQRIGGFKQKLFSLGGAFKVLDANDQPLCELKGNLVGWDFKFLAGENQLAGVSKKWDGAARQFLTSADTYMLTISPDVPPDNPVRQLILAAVICIDMVLKE